jgi:PAS domain S-box-containing protein
MNLFNRFKSIRTKIIFRLIGIYLISIMGALVFLYFSNKTGSRLIQQNSVQLINDNFQKTISAEINDAVNIVKNLSYLHSVSESKYSDIHEQQTVLSKHILELNSNVNAFFLVYFKNHKPNEISDTTNSLEYSMYKDDDQIITKLFDENDFNIDFTYLYNLHKDENVIISDPFMSKLTEKDLNCISIYTPLYSRNKVIGAVGINYSISDIIRLTNLQNQKNYYTKRLILSGNIIVASADKPFLSSKNILSVEGEEHILYNYMVQNNFKINSYNNNPTAFTETKFKYSHEKWQFITLLLQDSAVHSFINKNRFIFLILFSFLLTALLFILYFFHKSLNPLQTILRITEKQSLGEAVLDKKEESGNNEFSQIVRNLNRISRSIISQSDFCKQIAKGNYAGKLELRSDNDILSKSLNLIIDNLKNEEIDNVLKQEQEYQQLWMRRGRFELAETERNSEKSIESLTFNLIRTLVNYTDAVLGGIYITNETSNELRLTAAYAFGNKRQLKRNYMPGEGLPGSCLIEKKKILLSNIPEDYIRISSGLGSGIPKFLAFIPVFFQGKVNAVIEIAYIRVPEDYIIEFIESLSENIGAWIDSAVSGSKTSKLLEISKEQTKKLEQKEEELNAKVHELEKIQSETAVQNAEYSSMMNAINNTVMTVEYTLEGEVLNSNKIYEEVMGFSLDDIKGINVLDLVKDQQSDLLQIIKEVASGNHIKRQVKRYTKSGDVKWLSATYTPYSNKDGIITKVLFFFFTMKSLILAQDER